MIGLLDVPIDRLGDVSRLLYFPLCSRLNQIVGSFYGLLDRRLLSYLHESGVNLSLTRVVLRLDLGIPGVSLLAREGPLRLRF
jgi:hypothetical protein